MYAMQGFLSYLLTAVGGFAVIAGFGGSGDKLSWIALMVGLGCLLVGLAMHANWKLEKRVAQLEADRTKLSAPSAATVAKNDPQR